MRPTNGDTSLALASAQATACGNENISVILQLMLPSGELCRLNAFPRRGDLDQDAFAGDAVVLVKRDEMVGLGNQGLGVDERLASVSVETRPGMIFKNLQPEEDEQIIG